MALIALDDVISLRWLDHEKCEARLTGQKVNPWTLWAVHLSSEVLEAYPPPPKPRDPTEWEKQEALANQRIEEGLKRIRELWGTG
jgi:hypothetical protein